MHYLVRVIAGIIGEAKDNLKSISKRWSFTILDVFRLLFTFSDLQYPFF
jgi:hypothetical protein